MNEKMNIARFFFRAVWSPQSCKISPPHGPQRLSRVCSEWVPDWPGLAIIGPDRKNAQNKILTKIDFAEKVNDSPNFKLDFAIGK